ncbi:MAG TPA: FAD-dependent oxidoreductase [Nannocystaceae bacterium]|nr:FAD-dependent oxidoreductase [Nannocystaceae bacterium]
MSSAAETPAAPRDADVLVLGASFAGIELVYQLQRRSEGKPLRIVVVDRAREHGYLPLVQERLLGVLAPADSRLATASYLASIPGVRFVEGEVVKLEPERKTVTLAGGRELGARIVVVALGSVVDPPPSIPGHEHLLAHKFEDQFEHTRAALARVLSGRAERPRIVVVGGGITGCELAGELASLSGEQLARPEVTLVCREDRLVGNLRPRVARKVLAILQGQGVDVRLRATLTEAHADGVVVIERGEGADEQRVDIPCALALWAGGVRPAPVLGSLGLPRTDEGWLAVGPTLQCFATTQAKIPDVLACGDAVRIVGGDGEWPTMQRAIECLWQAKLVATNVMKLLEEPPGYPNGVPPLSPHTLRREFAYGVSLGKRSLVVWGALIVDLPGVNHWFRRWLMRRYFARYEPYPS